MAGRVCRELQRAKVNRLSATHLLYPPLFTQAMPIQPGRGSRRQRQLVLGNVIGMGVRNEASRQPTTNVDAKLPAGQKQTVVVVEQGEVARG